MRLAALRTSDGEVLRTAIDGIGTLTNRIRITARPTKEHA